MQIDGSSEDLSKQAATASATGRGKDVESGEEGEQGDSSVPSMSAAAFSPETRGGRGKAGGLEGARGDEGDNRAQAGSGREGKGKEKRKGIKGTREWIARKKDTQRKRGLEVRRDSKYTGRRRPGGF